MKDVRGQRIPNWLTYSGLLAALVVRAGLGGWTGLKGGLAGMLFAGGIFFLLFFIGGMGGGDVKLMAAVGAWVGLAQVGSLLIMSAIAGGPAGGRLRGGSQEDVGEPAQHGGAAAPSPDRRASAASDFERPAAGHFAPALRAGDCDGNFLLRW